MAGHATGHTPGAVGTVAPFAPSRSRWRPLGLTEVTIDSGFWAEHQDLNAAVMIAHCEEWLERTGWAGNFDAAAEGRLPQDRHGREFSDSEVYKLLEAMAWEVARTGDADIDARLQALTARVALAQEADGYLNTQFGRAGQAPRYTDLAWGHELYCFGHLIQAGVARARSGRDDQLVDVARRAADHVCEVFGPAGNPGVCGHPEIELALVELFRVTGARRYLDQARLFIDRRGHGVLGNIEFGRQYFQDDVPVRAATVLDGHAVRALYLAAAATDLAVEDDDQDLLDAVQSQVLHTLARRTYLTGGMGAHHEGESFGQDWELPPDRSYSETCAGIGSAMLNHRLLLATGDVRHADAVERTLINVVAGSPAQDGRAFYYTNPLQVRVPGSPPPKDVPSRRAAQSLRAPWFEVSCCPTNVTRTFASLAAYLASASDDGIQLHQFASCTIHADLPAGAVALRVTTAYPVEGVVSVEVLESPATGWELALRVPAWGSGSTLREPSGTRTVGPGYAVIRRVFRPGDQVVLDLPMEPRLTTADPRIDAVRGQVAVERGPVVLCLESADIGADVDLAMIDPTVLPVGKGDGAVVAVRVAEAADRTWPYGPWTSDRPMVAEPTSRPVSMVPYHRRAERGPGTMRVWVPSC